jgi:hypothetical protein
LKTKPKSLDKEVFEILMRYAPVFYNKKAYAQRCTEAIMKLIEYGYIGHKSPFEGGKIRVYDTEGKPGIEISEAEADSIIKNARLEKND